MVDQSDYIGVDCPDEIVFSNDFLYDIKKTTISYITQSYHNISTIIRHQNWFPQEIKNMSNYGVILHCNQNYPKQYLEISNLWRSIYEETVKNERMRLHQIMNQNSHNKFIFAKGSIIPNQFIVVNSPSIPQNKSLKRRSSRKNASGKNPKIHTTKRHSPKKSMLKSDHSNTYREIIDQTKRNVGGYPYIDSVFPPNYMYLATGYICVEIPRRTNNK
jgi:hypothetical protein